MALKVVSSCWQSKPCKASQTSSAYSNPRMIRVMKTISATEKTARLRKRIKILLAASVLGLIL
jgi:hypothetical protein